MSVCFGVLAVWRFVYLAVCCFGLFDGLVLWRFVVLVVCCCVCSCIIICLVPSLVFCWGDKVCFGGLRGLGGWGFW